MSFTNLSARKLDRPWNWSATIKTLTENLLCIELSENPFLPEDADHLDDNPDRTLLHERGQWLTGLDCP